MAERAQFSGRIPAGRPRSALAAALLVVAFVALAIAKPWEAPRLTPAPTGRPSTSLAGPSAGFSQSPPATLTPTSTASLGVTAPFVLAPPVADGTPWTAVRWRALAAGDPLSLVSRVVHWPGGYVALGDPGSGSGLLWASSDGSAWDPVGPGTASTIWPGLAIIGTAAIGSTLWAVTGDVHADTAGGGLPLGFWRTSDGRSWEAVPAAGLRSPPDSLSPILFAAFGTTLVLAWSRSGASVGPGYTELWTSPDGAAWRIAPASTLPTGFEIQALTTGPGGGLYAGGRIVASSGRVSAALLRSEDGQRWSQVPLPSDPGLPAAMGVAVVWALLPAASGILAVGSTVGDPAGEVWWRSADGRGWDALHGFSPLDPRPCGEGCGAFPAGLVAADGTLLVALGTETVHGLWTSRDARRWTVADAAGDVPDGGDQLVLLPAGVLVRAGDRAWLGEAVAAGG